MTSFTTITPYMNLVLPEPTLELGPAWASEVITALYLIDSHNHSPGQGEPVSSAGINVNADLTMSNFNLTNTRSIRFVNQTSPLSLSTDIGCIYESGGDFWYNNSIGQQVKITSGASLNAGAIGGIGGDYISSGALVFYTSGTQAYSMTVDGTNYANLLTGAVSIFQTGTTGFGITLQVPSLGANKILTLPAPPAVTSFLQITPTGVITSTTSTVGGITGSNIAAGTITESNLAPANYGISPSSGSGLLLGATSFTDVTNLSVTITTSGRPVRCQMQPDTIHAAGINSGAQGINIALVVDGVVTYIDTIDDAADNGSYYPVSMFQWFVPVLAAGSHTFKVQYKNAGSAAASTVSYATLVVMEV